VLVVELERALAGDPTTPGRSWSVARAARTGSSAGEFTVGSLRRAMRMVVPERLLSGVDGATTESW
jgi:hypothetical protein